VTEPGPAVVCDAGPLIHLAELRCLDLLSDFAEVYVPEEVRAEVARHRPEALDSAEAGIRIERVATLTLPAFVALSRTLALGRGEQAALSLASTRAGSILLTDDSAARLAARALDVRAHGTIGVLLRAIRRKLRSREHVLELLRNLPELSTLHIKRSLLAEIIRDVERG
jgi:predicted nucleic acid-binding protein